MAWLGTESAREMSSVSIYGTLNLQSEVSRTVGVYNNKVIASPMHCGGAMATCALIVHIESTSWVGGLHGN